MSRVFVAEETALGRKIVVKVLPHDTAAGVSAERFKREIQTAARLQHPHIVPLLSAGETDGLPFYTMPFVKGESLRARLTRGGELSVNEAIHVLRDVAAALAYAHNEGVVHRDIKPDNVILSGGVAVVTDFGVSKAVDVAATEGGGLKSGLTSLGVALGTPAYMSPEQASADPHVDHRADIYSFGCVAYELLTGASPFAGRPPQQMLAAHVTETPEPLSKRRPNVPPPLAALVAKCLEKRSGDRPQSAEELLNTLDAIGTPSGGMTPTAERLAAIGRSRPLWIGVAGAAVALAVFGASALLRAPSAAPYSLGATYPVAITREIESEPAISPDGKLVAYVGETPAGNRIFVRQVEGGRANLLTGELDGNHAWPRWSPDQQRIAFQANGAIYIVPALGGSSKRVIEGGVMPSWSLDGNAIVFADQSTPGGIWIQSLKDGSKRRVVEGAQLHSPVFSPDGQRLAYVEGQPLTMFNTSTNAIWVVPVTGGKAVRVSDSTHVNVSPVWAPDGKSLGRRMVFYTVRGDNTASVLEVTRNAQGTWSAPHRLTPETEAALNPQWSPDGSMIAYVRAGAGSTGQGIVGGEVAILPTASGPATVLAGTKAVDGSTQAVFWGKSSATVYVADLKH